MIMYDELSETLKVCKDNVAPGSDGLPIEFFKKFWYLIGPTFTEIVIDNFNNDNGLSYSQKESLIRLICKNDKFKEKLSYYRPISLLNSDYKLIAKTLSNRLKLALPQIIHQNQSFGIPGRSIQDNLTYINSIMAYIKSKNIPAIFLNIDQEKAFDRVSHEYLFKVIKSFGFGPNFQKWIKILYKDIKSKIIVNGFLSQPININRSVRQGCPIAPLLYVCVIETLLINIRNNNLITGLNSPCCNGKLLDSAFADDTNFFIKNITSVDNILITFKKYGKASGSKMNIDKTEAMWLGANQNNMTQPLDIKWVKVTKSLGIFFGPDCTNSLNWIPCIDKFRIAIMMQINRNVSIYGKAAILNYIGYSKIWHKTTVLLMPENDCIRSNGNNTNVMYEFKKYTLGLLWGFCENNQNGNNTETRIRNSLIKIDTLYLDKMDGGINLIDYMLKMKAFRIMLVYKYFDNLDKPWKKVLRYWFSSLLHHISGEGWNNSYPHVTDLNSTPKFFRQCILDFRGYYDNFGTSVLEKITTKKIYWNLIREKNHIPSVMIRFPEMEFNNCFKSLKMNKFTDPYLLQFLFKFYHGRLFFKKYKITRDDFLNHGTHKCILCEGCIDTPKHLFLYCSLGNELRNMQNKLILAYNIQSENITTENRIYSNFTLKRIDIKVIQFIITLSNYTLYKFKMNKFYNVGTEITESNIKFSFLQALKNRIICDHKNMMLNNFINTWDPGGNFKFLNYDTTNIISWRI